MSSRLNDSDKQIERSYDCELCMFCWENRQQRESARKGKMCEILKKTDNLSDNRLQMRVLGDEAQLSVQKREVQR